MGKVALVIRSLRRKDFAIKFWGTFLTVLALPSALLTILGAHWSVLSTSFLVLVALFFSVFVHRHRLAKMHLPLNSDLFSTDKTYVHCPCDLNLADAAKQLAHDSYPIDRSIAPDRFEQLRVKNSVILACLTAPDGELLGYFDVIPLREHFALLFLKGAVTEMQITHEDVLGRREMRSCKYLFISGLAVRNPENQDGSVSASILVWAIMRYLQHFYSAAEPMVFALASSSAGDSLLRKFKFEIGCAAEGRIDRYKLYKLQLTRTALLNRLECVPDWSMSCSLEWALSDNGKKKSSPGRRATLPKRKTYTLTPPFSPNTA